MPDPKEILILDGALELEFVTRADELGAFDLGRVPRIAGARLLAEHPGYSVAERDAPAHDDVALRLELEPLAPAPDGLRGCVVDAHGRPAPRAWVSAGSLLIQADEHGLFAIERGPAERTAELLAALPGHLPARARADVQGETSLWPDFVVVTFLGPTTASSSRGLRI